MTNATSVSPFRQDVAYFFSGRIKRSRKNALFLLSGEICHNFALSKETNNNNINN